MYARLNRTSMVVLLVLVLAAAGTCPARTIVFPENRGADGIRLARSSRSDVALSFGLERVVIEDVVFHGRTMQRIAVGGVSLPADAGAPDLPGFGRFLALPEGAFPRLEILSMETETVTGIDLIPAAALPFENEDGPLEHTPDRSIYESNSPYPREPIRLSEVKQMRGVDVAVLGVTPFQYNPVKRELTIIKSASVRVTFEGGTGRFGEDRLRSRHWEPILRSNLMNYDQLPGLELSVPSSRDAEYEYVIIVPDDSTYIAWADSLRVFRTLQGIDTGVVTLSETGAEHFEIEAWIDTAYARWQTPPAAVLLLADWVETGVTTGITSRDYDYGYSCVSDNYYADVGDDHLPDIVLARMAVTPQTIETVVRKAIDYERYPSTNPGFYDNPVLACGWQDDRWFALTSEVIYGFMANELGKSPVREYGIYSGAPDTLWSTDVNTPLLVDYFGPDSLGYIPATPEHLTDWGGSAARLNADMNAGAFLVHHRDHGNIDQWGTPHYDIGDMEGLSNCDMPFVLSISCQTGTFNVWDECFAEAFHRHPQRAVGIIAASNLSMPFVNDVYSFGIMDGMWPGFDPGYPAGRGRAEGPADLRPAYAHASAKYYLEASGWPSNPAQKELTYYLYHMHGDAFTTLYSEVPQQLTVSHDCILAVGDTTFAVTADAGAMVALTLDGEIIGVAAGTGLPMDMEVTPATQPGLATLMVTKANHERYAAEIPVAQPVSHDITPAEVPINIVDDVTVTVWDDLGIEKPDVVVTIEGLGVVAMSDTTDTLGQAHFSVLAPYGEDLVVTGYSIGEPGQCLLDALPVVGGFALPGPAIDAGVPTFGFSGWLTPYYEGEVTATAAIDSFTLYAAGCGLDEVVSAGPDTTAQLSATPTTTGTVSAAVAKSGYEVYREEIAVDAVYGHVEGEIIEAATFATVGGVRVKAYPAGVDTSAVGPVFSVLSDEAGFYLVPRDLVVGYYNVCVEKFEYAPHAEEVFVGYGANNIDFVLADAPVGTVSGHVTDENAGFPLPATVRFYRGDTMELYAETTSDLESAGYYEMELPYYGYVVQVSSDGHRLESRPIDVAGPLTEDFVLGWALGRVLVIDDMDPVRESGGRDGDDPRDSARAPDAIAADLAGLGYYVTVETSGSSDPATWSDYHLIVSSSGDDISPVEDSAYRAALEAHVAGGGRLLIEGGEVAADAAANPGYPSFCSDVLHVALWKYNIGGDLMSYDALHSVASTPNQIDLVRFTAIGIGDQDACIPTADAVTVFDWEYRSGVSGVIAYDDNEDPTGGQIVFFEFDYTSGEESGMEALLENAVAYLTAIEGTGVPEEGPAGTPAHFVLRGIAPNPFNPMTSVSYGLPSRGRVAIRIHDVSGRLVRTLVDGEKDAGYSEAVWDGRDDRGLEVASGVYFCRMEAGTFSATAKMVLLK